MKVISSIPITIAGAQPLKIHLKQCKDGTIYKFHQVHRYTKGWGLLRIQLQ